MDPTLNLSAVPFSAMAVAPDQILIRLDPGAGMTLTPDQPISLTGWSGDTPPPYGLPEPQMSVTMSMSTGVVIGLAVSAVAVAGLVWWSRRQLQKMEVEAAAARPHRPTSVPPAAQAA